MSVNAMQAPTQPDVRKFMGKGEKLIEMVKAAIRYRIPFDYLLVDSWFTNTGLVDFVCSCHKKFHLLGMAKNGITYWPY